MGSSLPRDLCPEDQRLGGRSTSRTPASTFHTCRPPGPNQAHGVISIPVSCICRGFSVYKPLMFTQSTSEKANALDQGILAFEKESSNNSTPNSSSGLKNIYIKYVFSFRKGCLPLPVFLNYFSLNQEEKFYKMQMSGHLNSINSFLLSYYPIPHFLPSAWPSLQLRIK